MIVCLAILVPELLRAKGAENDYIAYQKSVLAESARQVEASGDPAAIERQRELERSWDADRPIKAKRIGDEIRQPAISKTITVAMIGGGLTVLLAGYLAIRKRYAVQW